MQSADAFLYKSNNDVNKELIINAAPNGVEIALLEDKKLVELHYSKTSK